MKKKNTLLFLYKNFILLYDYTLQLYPTIYNAEYVTNADSEYYAFDDII